jgi:protein-disulfide isomerase
MRALAIALLFCSTVASAAPPDQITRVEHRPEGDAPSIGPSDALVTVELFFVPVGGQSRVAYKALAALQAKHPRRMRLVLRPVEHAGHILDTEAVMEAFAEGKFFDMFDAVSGAGRQLSRQDLLDLATQVGVDPARVEAAWDDERHKPALDANEARRLRHYAIGTPDAVFNGRRVERTLLSLSENDLENAYQDAYDRAQELLATGVPRKALAEAFDRAITRPTTLFVPGPVDDDAAGDPTPDLPPLLSRPLDLAGLPSTGPAAAPVPIVVFCDLGQRTCIRQISVATKMLALFPGDVRVVWSPWYAPDEPNAENADAAARAALCAEEQGAGWDWVEKALGRTQRLGPTWGGDAALRQISDDAGADGKALETCMNARPLDRAMRRIQDAVTRGVRHGPAVVVGGRIYIGGVSEDRILQGLIEDELAPGLLGRAAPDWQTD